MEDKGTWLEDGEDLLETFRYLENILSTSDFINPISVSVYESREQFILEVKAFISDAENYVNDIGNFINGHSMLRRNRKRVNVKEEYDTPFFNEFYLYGITIDEIVQKIKSNEKGPELNLILDGKFHYHEEAHILYRDKIQKVINSNEEKRHSLVCLVFRNRYDGTTVEEVDSFRKEELLSDYGEDKLGYDPYNWERNVCYKLNKAIQKQFQIPYNLFEMKGRKIKLNEKAK
ncbi:hypothetical protein IJJ53_00650 [Candidatus Saccharibacteria bacterium]|nr:hypothetical protein [Candidatus Saccharibacteria bacterium]